jgi:methylenetetrahydrofolate dehydrogenase (NADP+)/methenyltetrahydrofolate cyclohydrolase
MMVFDGNLLAQSKEAEIARQVAGLRQQGIQLKIAAVLFTEDQGSQLYTRLKSEAAQRVGIGYQVITFSMRDAVEEVVAAIQQLNSDHQVTGIIIQKPWRSTWIDVVAGDVAGFDAWWHSLTSQIDQTKDVDGLHPQTLAALEHGTWQPQTQVMPATAQAVLEIIDHAKQSITIDPPTTKVVVLGKSDILGKPLTYSLRHQGYQVEMIGSSELRQRVSSGQLLLDADVVVSSTGRHHLVTGDLVKDGVIAIDVGEPRPDIDFASVSPKAAFITPVPGGVGPMTVVCLLENAVRLAN